MDEHDIERQLDAFLCQCGHQKMAHDWFGSADCTDCDCKLFVPSDEQEFDRLSALYKSHQDHED